MRIFHRDSSKTFDSMEIFLTIEEADELRARIEGLVNNPKAHHIHLDTDEKDGVMQKELTVAVYTNDNLQEFDERSREIIINDK